MMAPYAVGHLKIAYLLEELGHALQKDERFQLYLTNTLDMQELEETKLPGMSSLAEESHLAGKVKKESPILVILGNPPYSGHSANAAWKMEVKHVYGPKLEPEDIFNYIYAVLYSNNYRTKYVEFLKTDFPRVPFVKDRNLFRKMVGIGQELVSLHLIKSDLFHEPGCRFQGKGNRRVEKKEYSANQKRVCINQTQYFEGVELEVWEYHVGGYQVLDQWLKDHRRRILSTEDIKYYCRVVTALAKTIEMQHEIDELYPQVEKDVITIAS